MAEWDPCGEDDDDDDDWMDEHDETMDELNAAKREIERLRAELETARDINVLEEGIKLSSAKDWQDLAECRRLLREALADMEGGGWFEVGPKSNWAIAAREAAGGTDG